MAQSSYLWRLSILAGSLALVSATTFAIAEHNRSIQLRWGESYTTQDRFGSITIQCGGSGGYPDRPGYPGNPGTPSCSTFDFDSKLQRLNMRRDLLSRGECGYRRADGFMRCEGLLGRHEVASQKEAFNRDLLELKSLVEISCRTRSCAQIDISRMLRDYDTLLSSVQFSRIIYDGYRSVAFVDFPQNLQVHCSIW
jgi:hypothetical protein